ncbi:hypothetical protein [Blastococcus sp. CCUG 61487]|uniref:hypothetical protein n=1 Tax=Blastococcus sp. CCUG 61487 TaxID=1840703 RepID=UPI0010BF8779|nr:hypothetical protein [Blastococcus sp. CCUG 61487]TKJ27402.1 hypothetical protein A6V29_03315 [Blastococcus sp. CCUG 61487]
MRLSRVLLAGAAVAAAAVATSAFTAGNDVQDSVAGYGDAAVTGAKTTNIDYVLHATDKSEVTSIDFDVQENFDVAVTEGLTAWLQLQEADGDPVGGPVSCNILAFATDHTPINCPLPPGTKIASFDRIGLTVSE